MATQLDNVPPVDAYIAPWVLPKESIPIHVGWKEGFEFSTVRITIPDGFVFDDFLNLHEVTFDKNECLIDHSNLIRGEKTTFFGFVIRYDRIPAAVEHVGKVELLFQSGNNRQRFSLEARVFRPFLECTSAPTSIELKDDTGANLPLTLRYRGFGDVKLLIEGRIGGQIVSQGTSVALEVVRRLWQAETSEEAKRSTNKQVEIARKGRLEVEDGYVKEVADQVQRILDSGEIPREMMTKEDLDEMRRWLQNTKQKGRLMEIVYSRVEELVLSMLVDLILSKPTSNVSLAETNPRISADIRAPIVDLVVRLRYSDVLKNDYDPVEIKVRIIDSRKRGKSGTTIDIPIRVEKWIDEPLRNVAGI